MFVEYRHVEEAFMFIYQIKEENRGMFRARLRHLRNLGIPEGVDVGTGKRALYGRDEIYQMGFALQLVSLQTDPVLSAALVLAYYNDKIREWIWDANHSRHDRKNDWKPDFEVSEYSHEGLSQYVAIQLKPFTPRQASGANDFERFEVHDSMGINKLLGQIETDPFPNISIFSLTAMLRKIDAAFYRAGDSTLVSDWP